MHSFADFCQDDTVRSKVSIFCDESQQILPEAVVISIFFSTPLVIPNLQIKLPNQVHVPPKSCNKGKD